MALLAVTIALIAVATKKSSSPTTNNYIVHNAVVHTVDSLNPRASAFVVQNGKFVEVGDSATLLGKYDYRRIDARGRTVIPGLTDAHGHLVSLGLRFVVAVSCLLAIHCCSQQNAL